jgi:ADP-ribose pyrophosphatase YjhB (NUDIX family)
VIEVAMSFDINLYRTGYSLGVGGVVMHGDKVLLVNAASGPTQGQWMLPGGFVERDETMDTAIRREIMEEAGVTAEVHGLIGVRNRTMPDENSMYLIFLLSAASDKTQPDGVEIAEARYFTFQDIQDLPKLRTLSRIIITSVFENKVKVMTRLLHPDFSQDEFVLFT